MSDEWGSGDAGGNGDWGAPSGGISGAAMDFVPRGDNFNAPGPVDGGDGDTACRNCGEEGHFARECPQPRKGGGACFNCGEEGHTKSACTQPRVFKGTCRICNQEGHPAFECPEKPADVCRNCRKEGHMTVDCKENRKFDLNDVPDKLPAEAWAELKKADKERDLTEFREAFKVVTKAEPLKTYVDIETKLRAEQSNVFLIALEKEVGDTLSLIDLQGKLDRTYVVGFYFNAKPQRANLKDRWPPSPEENLTRLGDAGIPYDRGIPKCGNCGELGHSFKGCTMERNVIERLEIKCVNCSEVGHRARDCTQARRDKFACRNCGSADHKAADCTEPRSAANVECHKCNEVGHFAKDCPQAAQFSKACRNCGSEDHVARECDQPRNMDNVQCRNCDEMGHFSRDCTKKRDYSRVKCNNCGEMGHTVKRCPQPVENNPETESAANGGGWGASDDGPKEPTSSNLTATNAWGGSTSGGGGGDGW